MSRLISLLVASSLVLVMGCSKTPRSPSELCQKSFDLLAADKMMPKKKINLKKALAQCAEFMKAMKQNKPERYSCFSKCWDKAKTHLEGTKCVNDCAP